MRLDVWMFCPPIWLQHPESWMLAGISPKTIFSEHVFFFYNIQVNIQANILRPSHHLNHVYNFVHVLNDTGARPQTVFSKTSGREASERHLLGGIWEASAGRHLGGIWEASGRHLGGIWETSGDIWETSTVGFPP